MTITDLQHAHGYVYAPHCLIVSISESRIKDPGIPFCNSEVPPKVPFSYNQYPINFTGKQLSTAKRTNLGWKAGQLNGRALHADLISTSGASHHGCREHWGVGDDSTSPQTGAGIKPAKWLSTQTDVRLVWLTWSLRSLSSVSVMVGLGFKSLPIVITYSLHRDRCTGILGRRSIQRLSSETSGPLTNASSQAVPGTWSEREPEPQSQRHPERQCT